MIEQELISMFSQLDVNEKRNQISAELEKLKLLLDNVHEQFYIEKMPSSMHAYNKVTDQKMSNEDYFNFIYQDIIFLRKDILTLVNALMKNKNDVM